MEKKILCALVVIVIVAVGTINVNMSKIRNHKGDLALSNVEALADGETTTTCTVSTNCYTDPWKPDKLTGTVSCTGTNCTRTNTSVTCDDLTTSC